MSIEDIVDGVSVTNRISGEVPGSSYQREGRREMRIDVKTDEFFEYRSEVKKVLEGLPDTGEYGMIVGRLIEKIEENGDGDFFEKAKMAAIRHEYQHLEIDLSLIMRGDVQYLHHKSPQSIVMAAKEGLVDKVLYDKLKSIDSRLGIAEEARAIIAESVYEPTVEELANPNTATLDIRMAELLEIAISEDFRFPELIQGGYDYGRHKTALLYLLLKNASILNRSFEGNIDLLRRNVISKIEEYMDDPERFIRDIHKPNFIAGVDRVIIEEQVRMDRFIGGLDVSERKMLCGDADDARKGGK